MMNEQVWADLIATKAADDGPTIYTFLASDATIDRQGEVVTADGWELANYLRNPIILDSHQYDSIDHIIGRAVDVRSTEHGLEADVIFNDTPRGMIARQLVNGGDLRAVSVGFKPIEIKFEPGKDTPPAHTKKELMEISAVAVPANPNALRLRSLHADETPDDGAAVVKAGRVLSAKNESRLKQALSLLTEVLAELGEPEPAEQQTIDIDLAALKALVGKE